MNDLRELNRRIAEHWLGSLEPNQKAYLSYAPVCLGHLPHSAAALAQVLARSMQRDYDPLRVAKLNRHYLRFARLAAKDVAAGKLEMLIRLGLSVEQVELLGKLTDEDLARLALDWDGPIIGFASQAFERGVALHGRAVQYHAAALVATHLAP